MIYVKHLGEYLILKKFTCIYKSFYYFKKNITKSCYINIQGWQKVHCKKTYSCSLTSFLTCIIDLENFCNNVFDDSLAFLHTSMMVEIRGTLVEDGRYLMNEGSWCLNKK